MAQQKPAYQLFDAKGKQLTYKKAFKQVRKADILFFGEQHNDPIGHWLTLEILKDLIEERGAEHLLFGLEMFETHQQTALDGYMEGSLDAKTLVSEHNMWKNFRTDYQPLLDLCKEHDISVIATNIPRKYARMVSREGQESLTSLPGEEQALIAPLPFPVDYDLPSYARMKDMLAGHGGGMKAEYFIAAQASKDATMAHRILQHYMPGKLFYHLNGAYHSDDKEGIIWHIRQQQPDLNIANISVVVQADISDLEAEHAGKADVVIVVPENMTKTYVSEF